MQKKVTLNLKSRVDGANQRARMLPDQNDYLDELFWGSTVLGSEGG